MPDDLYSVLGVGKAAEQDSIKKAYRKLAKDLHPDKNPGNKQAEARFKKVNHAFDVLGDPKKRKLYDEFGEDGLRDGFDADKARQYREWASRQGGGRVVEGFPGGGTVSLEDLFGGGGAGGAGGVGGAGGGFGDMFGDFFSRRRQRGPQKGADLESEITIDFKSAVEGATLELRPMAGRPAVTVRIPQGAADGSRVRIAGQGAPSPSGGAAGDLLLTVHVQSHPFFRREGDDLHLDLPIAVAEAYKGAKVKVPTIAGHVTMKVPERSQSGSVVRLRGKGVSRKGHAPGDLYVHFLVHVPVKGGADLDQLVEKMAAFQTEDLRAGIKW